MASDEEMLSLIKKEIQTALTKERPRNSEITQGGELTFIGVKYCEFLERYFGGDYPRLFSTLGFEEDAKGETGKKLNFKQGLQAGKMLKEMYDTKNPIDSISFDSTNEDFIQNCSQIIYYGVPGSGKSTQIYDVIRDIPEIQKSRVVFHPDYCNADFIGQILPKSKAGDVDYVFKPGPFTRILWNAYHNPGKKYYLIIEEINRGNAAAIFGEVFQLLDRINSDKKASDGYGIGWSKYSIDNEYINTFLRSDESGEETKNSDIFGKDISFDSHSKIRLPPNLAIYATMNTSDQNVFTLDNAFQRRWKMKLVSNNLPKESDQYKLNIHCKGHHGKSICWGAFRDGINLYISEQNTQLSSMEDCQLGAYFVHSEDNIQGILAEDFACKVLKYLWDDVFRMDRESVFRNKGSFETAIMNQIGKEADSEIDLYKIFLDTVCEKIENLTEENS